jgi:hypothetical protein
MLVSLGFGLLVAGVAVLVAWHNYGSFWALSAEQRTTRNTILRLREEISAYQQRHWRWPESLLELREARGSAVDEGGVILDGWGRPFRYSAQQGGFYEIVSLGRDGAPGGEGLDSDPTNTSRWLLSELPSWEIIYGFLLTGGIAPIAALITIRAPDLRRGGLAGLALKLATVGLVAGLLAAIHCMTALSGH